MVTMRTATKKNSEHRLIATVDPFPLRRARRHGVLRGEHGQTLAEYGLILALVVLVAIAGLSAFGAGLTTMMIATFNAVIAAL